MFFWSELANRRYNQVLGGCWLVTFLVELLSYDRMKATFASLSKACRRYGNWLEKSRLWPFCGIEFWIIVWDVQKITERWVMLYLKYSRSSTQIQKCGNGISFFPKSSSCNQTWILKQLQQTTTKTWDTWDVTFLYPTTKKLLTTPCFPVDSKRKPLDKVVHVFGP